MSDDWPRFSDELARKTTATVSKWFELWRAGKTTDREVFIWSSALYDSVSGLVPRDVSEMVAVINKSAKDAIEARRAASRGEGSNGT